MAPVRELEPLSRSPRRTGSEIAVDMTRKMRFIALSLWSLLLAHVASSQGPGSPVQASTAHFTRPKAIEAGNQTGSAAIVSFRHDTSDAFLAPSAVSDEIQTPDQLLAAFGLHKLSIRISSWRAVGRGPERGHTVEGSWRLPRKGLVFARVDYVDRDDYELVRKRPRPEGAARERMSVDAGTFGFVRDLKLFQEAETGFGGEVTLYRFGSTFDPVSGRHPVSIHGFFRIRFGSRIDTSQTSPIGHSMSM
jgi:hypothetical protein